MVCLNFCSFCLYIYILLSDSGAAEFDFRPFVLPIYSATLKWLRATDVDQEVKERAIVCMGQVVACMGDSLEEGLQLAECMPIFVDRLRNEITRLTTVRAITQIAK